MRSRITCSMKGGSPSRKRKKRGGLLVRCDGGVEPCERRSRRATTSAFIHSFAVVLVLEASSGAYGRVAARRSSTTVEVERSEPSTGPPPTRPPFFPTTGTNNRFHGGLCLNRYPPCNMQEKNCVSVNLCCGGCKTAIPVMLIMHQRFAS